MGAQIIPVCWVVYGRTESGDDLQCLVFKHLPTDDEVEKEYQKLYPYEYEEVGFVSWFMCESEIQD